jgi:uncharacterized protein (TIGR02118 family)
MIRVTYALRRRSDLSPEEFSRYWREEHAPLLQRHAAELGIRRYVQAHTTPTALDKALRMARSVEPEPYDGVAEIYFDSVDALVAAVSTEKGQAIAAELVEDERRFVDLDRSPIWIAEEHLVIG